VNKLELFKKLLPGFLPLFVFIAADEIWGTKIGLIVAVGVGIVELIWVGISEKRFDKFILFDTALLVLLGGISIILENDIFFKLKPGLIEIILVAILGVSAFSSLNIVGLMSKRYMKDIQMNEMQVIQMRKSLNVMFFLFLFHTILVFYSVFFMSKEAWAFISGGLFYILFGIYFLFELIRQRIKNKIIPEEEWLPIVNEKGEVIGKAPRSQVHKGDKILHPVVHMHVINKNKAILLQKRPANKLVQPGKWDTAVGGHISIEETLDTALKREAFEEIGLKNFKARLLKIYRWDTEIESELVYTFMTNDTKAIGVQSTEVDELRFWTKNQIDKGIGTGDFTPNLEHELTLLKTLGIR
jgi:isopentenyldiphosphate isomerase/intracellular septation protein A